MENKSKLGMVLFLISEATFFIFLILAYVYFHYSVIKGPTATNSLDPVKSGIYSLFLLSSSFTLWRAEKHLQRGNKAGLCTWLFVTILFGGIFLAGQGLEYLHLFHDQVTISRNLFGTTFFTLTGFHGLHVLLGLIILTVVLGLALAGDFTGPESSGPVGTIALYWHFVDAVWVVIFSVVYLWAFL